MAHSARGARVRTIAYKCTLYGVLLFLIAVMQVSFFSKINVLGAPPDLLLASIVLLAMHEDHRVSTVCGIIAGFFYCALGGFSYPLYLIFAFFCGYVFWGISEHAFGKNYPSFIAFCALAFGIKAIYNMVEISLSAQSFSIIGVFASLLLPEFISSMLFCSVSYIILIWLIRILNKKSMSRKERKKNERKLKSSSK